RLGAGVEAVFDQFLERSRGAVDHFPGGDLVDEELGKSANRAHVQCYTARAKFPPKKRHEREERHDPRDGETEGAVTGTGGGGPLTACGADPPAVPLFARRLSREPAGG